MPIQRKTCTWMQNPALHFFIPCLHPWKLYISAPCEISTQHLHDTLCTPLTWALSAGPRSLSVLFSISRWKMRACRSFLSWRMTPCACRTFSLSVCRATARALLFTWTLFRTNGFTVAVEGKIYWKIKLCCDLQSLNFLPSLYELLCNTNGDVRVHGKQMQRKSLTFQFVYHRRKSTNVIWVWNNVKVLKWHNS